MSLLSALYTGVSGLQTFGDSLQVIGISQDEVPADLVRKFAIEHRMNYPVVMSSPMGSARVRSARSSATPSSAAAPSPRCRAPLTMRATST